MAKEPTLFNNLLRRFREHKFPGLSIAKAAEQLGLPATYLTKIENGDLRRPNERYLEFLEKSYSREKSQDYHPLHELNKFIDVLPADDGETLTQLPNTMVWGTLNRFLQDAKPLLVHGRGYVLDENALFMPWVVSRVMYSSECLMPYLASKPDTAAERLKNYFEHNTHYQILDWNEADPLSKTHATALFIPGFLLAYTVCGMKTWGVTANMRALEEWDANLANAKSLANPARHINSVVAKMQKVVPA